MSPSSIRPVILRWPKILRREEARPELGVTQEEWLIHMGARSDRSSARPSAQELIELMRKLMPRLQQVMNRAQLTQEEVHILRGIARAAASAPAGGGSKPG